MSGPAIDPLPGWTASTNLVVGTASQHPSVGVIQLARPKKLNAIELTMWQGFPKAIEALQALDSVRVIVLCAQGAHFTAGIDLGFLTGEIKDTFSKHKEPSRRRDAVVANIQFLQDSISSMEKCRLPVIAAVQGMCIGGGVDLICACDIRVCSRDASFSVKEVDVGILPDLGTLPRLQQIVGHGVAMDLSLTCRRFDAQEALRIGLVTQILGDDGSQLYSQAIDLAAQVASKARGAVIGTKHVMLHAREIGNTAESLKYIALYNTAVLDDLFSSAGGAGLKGGARGSTGSSNSGGPPRSKL